MRNILLADGLEPGDRIVLQGTLLYKSPGEFFSVRFDGDTSHNAIPRCAMDAAISITRPEKPLAVGDTVRLKGCVGERMIKALDDTYAWTVGVAYGDHMIYALADLERVP